MGEPCGSATSSQVIGIDKTEGTPDGSGRRVPYSEVVGLRGVITPMRDPRKEQENTVI